MRRSAFDVAGLYDEELPFGYAEDYDWLLRATRVGPGGRRRGDPRRHPQGRPVPGSGAVCSTPPRRSSTCWTSIRTSANGVAVTPGSSGRSPMRVRRPASAARARGSRAAPCAAIRSHRTHGWRSRSPARASIPADCSPRPDGWGEDCREPAAQLLVRRPGQGRVVLDPRDAAQAPRRLPDPGEGSLLLRPLLRPRPRVVPLAVRRCPRPEGRG